MRATLIIDGQLNNLNDYTKACRTNRYAGAHMKKENEELISHYIRMQLHKVKFEGQVKIDFTWYEPNKRRDLDNTAFGKKFILDALVSNGIIASDGWAGVVGFTDSFYVDKENPRIEVVIKDGEDEN